jgi:hypothetical protein
MSSSTDHHDPYVLYVRAYRQHPERWYGSEPPCAKGQLAIALGREDVKLMGTDLKTRAAFVLEMDRYNAEPIDRFSSRVSPRTCSCASDQESA